MNFDVFNGDADGICALIQLRLAEPKSAQLITGIKRDINLLNKFTVNAGDQVTVLDISLQKNSSQVDAFLKQGAHIFYVDHHQSSDIQRHPNFTTLINTDSTICTSLLVNQYLHGQHPLWAITAAFGDNLTRSAEQLAASLDLKSSVVEILKNLGIYVNYNSYGNCIADLLFAPDKLYQKMAGFKSPLDFISDTPEIFRQLEQNYQEDMLNAQLIKPEYHNNAICVYILPDTAWARRVNGVFGNYLANLNPKRAHAVITHCPDSTFQVSVRAPLAHKNQDNQPGADQLCSAFPSGGGRKAAAGINHLAKDQLNNFIQRFEEFYCR